MGRKMGEILLARRDARNHFFTNIAGNKRRLNTGAKPPHRAGLPKADLVPARHPASETDISHAPANKFWQENDQLVKIARIPRRSER
jgi:hypothetical protein